MSELLALVLGIAITIAVGMTIYTFMPNYISSMQQQQRIALVVQDVFSISSSESILTISIRNLGTKEIKEINTTILSPANLDIELIAPKIEDVSSEKSTLKIAKIGLSPGLETILTIRLRGSSIGVGSKIIIAVSARYIDGSMASASTQALIA
ncbi:MAG: hypothetical protein N3D82_02010 [Ignisphaera sp.]|nr:hypothetical protein [Ignisphaera sp.]MCX8167794.1 hypothetical protein [Ignisphaera sp.]MDW8086197.1 hypothetical protein [Ignisphaera sp.]